MGGLLVVGGLLSDVVLGGQPGFGAKQLLLVGVGLAFVLFGFLSPGWRIRTTLVCGSVGVSLLLFELALRLLLGAQLAVILEYDEELLFRLVPDAEKSTPHLPENRTDGNDRVLLRTNSAGNRGPELAAGEGRQRLVVYGDSFVLARATDYERTLPVQLQTLLHAAGQEEIEVVNARVSGYGLDQIYLRMRQEFDRAAPAHAVLSVYSGNDFGDPVRNKLFYLDGDGELVRNEGMDLAPLRASLAGARREPHLFRAFDLTRQSMRARGASPKTVADPFASPEEWLDSARRDYVRYVVEGDRRVTGSVLRDYYDADVAMDPESDSARYKIRMLQELLAAIKSLCDRHAVPLTILIVPHPIDAIEGYEFGQVDARKHPKYSREGLSAIVQRAVEELAIPHVNLLEVFGESNVAQYYLRGGDPHWSARGQALAARELAELVNSSLSARRGEAE